MDFVATIRQAPFELGFYNAKVLTMHIIAIEQHAEKEPESSSQVKPTGMKICSVDHISPLSRLITDYSTLTHIDMKKCGLTTLEHFFKLECLFFAQLEDNFVTVITDLPKAELRLFHCVDNNNVSFIADDMKEKLADMMIVDLSGNRNIDVIYTTSKDPANEANFLDSMAQCDGSVNEEPLFLDRLAAMEAKVDGIAAQNTEILELLKKNSNTLSALMEN